MRLKVNIIVAQYYYYLGVGICNKLDSIIIEQNDSKYI